MKKHRKEEVGSNLWILSGRIVSKIYYGKEQFRDIDKEVKIRRFCRFVLLIKGEYEDDIFSIKLNKQDLIKQFINMASTGCRVVLQGQLKSRRRITKIVKQTGLENYVVELRANQIINIFMR